MYHKYLKFTLAATLAFSSFQIAAAEDKIVAETCFPVERAFALLEDSSTLDANRRNSVDTFVEAFFVDVETRTSPMTLWLKNDETRDSFAVDDSGEIKDFHHKITNASNGAIICGASQEDGKIGLGRMSTSVRFKNNSGTHTLAEILDGVRDGKKHYQKNLGGVQAMFVPKMTHIAIVYDVPETIPNIFAIANGENILVEFESYGEMLVINVEALKESHAESIIVGVVLTNYFLCLALRK